MNDRYQNLQRKIDQLLEHKNNLNILEAGCGSTSKIHLKNVSKITGIDISKKQLNCNTVIHEKILGDIQTYKLSASTYDVIVCWNVLEHLKKPKLAVLNFFHAIKDDGLIILALPNVFSVKGLITKYTPLWFHKLIYIYIYKNKKMVTEEKGPFKTYLRYFTAPKSLLKFSRKNGFRPVYFSKARAIDGWVGEKISNKSKFLYSFIASSIKIAKKVTFNQISYSDYIVILKTTDAGI